MTIEKLNSFHKLNIKVNDGISLLNLGKTFNSGECFRWEKLDFEKEAYIGVIFGTVVIVLYGIDGKSIDVYSKDKLEEQQLIDYFDLSTDYNIINNNLIKDKVMVSALEKSLGIRLLKQDFYEVLISFIISANNNIPRIKKCINNICKKYGKYICKIDDVDYYSFPLPENLANTDPLELQNECRVGYRAPYITKASKQFLIREVDLDKIKNSCEKEALKEILKYNGVGNKVANCILLFSGLRKDSFPVDVWVERMMVKLYGLNEYSRIEMEKWGKNYFGENAGIAQQYLFNYIRDLEL